jgi:hypothetical protein
MSTRRFSAKEAVVRETASKKTERERMGGIVAYLPSASLLGANRRSGRARPTL